MTVIVADVALFPWEDIDMAVREQAEQEIWSDAEYQQWLDALLAVPVEEMGELEFMAHMADQLEAQIAPKTLSLTEEMLSEIEAEDIGADFCRQPFLY